MAIVAKKTHLKSKKKYYKKFDFQMNNLCAIQEAFWNNILVLLVLPLNCLLECLSFNLSLNPLFCFRRVFAFRGFQSGATEDEKLGPI